MAKPTLSIVPSLMEEEEKKPNKVELSDLDADFIRVLEDLIDALIANGALRLTDLPPPGTGKTSTAQECPSTLA